MNKSQNDRINNEASFSNSKFSKKNQRIKPKYYKLLGQIMNSHMDVIFNFIV